MDVQQQLDLYCERLGPGLWAEPLNALSNLAFLIAAYLLFHRSQTSSPQAPAAKEFLLVALVVLVGLGSAAFHTYATVWGRWLDLLFIELFIYIYIALYLRRVHALQWLAVVAILIAFAGFEWALTQAFTPGSFNGSYRYLPALLGVGTMSAAALIPSASRRAPFAARHLGWAGGIFVLAIVFRSLDMALCEQWPWGTHFIWHGLNALVLYFCVSALRRSPV